jgi:hypothetical protein
VGSRNVTHSHVVCPRSFTDSESSYNGSYSFANSQNDPGLGHSMGDPISNAKRARRHTDRIRHGTRTLGIGSQAGHRFGSALSFLFPLSRFQICSSCSDP